MAVFTKQGAVVFAVAVLNDGIVPAMELRLFTAKPVGSAVETNVSQSDFTWVTTAYGGGAAKSLTKSKWAVDSTTGVSTYSPVGDTTFTATGTDWANPVKGYAIVAKGASTTDDKVVFYQWDSGATATTGGFNMTVGSSYAVTLSVSMS